jgi:hypothetical protein
MGAPGPQGLEGGYKLHMGGGDLVPQYSIFNEPSTNGSLKGPK